MLLDPDPRCGPPDSKDHPLPLPALVLCLGGRVQACERVPSFPCTGKSPADQVRNTPPVGTDGEGTSTGAWLLRAGGAAHRAEAGSSAPPASRGRDRVAWQCPSPPVPGVAFLPMESEPPGKQAFSGR